jgi:surface antigen
MKIQITRVAAATATALFALLAIQPAAAQYGQDQQYNNQYQNNRNSQNNRDYENSRDNRNGRNEHRADAFDPPRDRSKLWERRYSRVYTTNDDNYYQNCTGSADPTGVIAGALIGGLLGNAAGRGNSGATIAGIIAGGAVGGSLTRNLSCEDRSYSYKTYYNAFNAGRANQQYQWANPNSGRRGVVTIGSYYDDPDGFRCATFSQSIYIRGRAQQARGRACQQPDGVWAIVG